MSVADAFEMARSFRASLAEQAEKAHPLLNALAAGGSGGLAGMSGLSRGTDLAHHAEQYKHNQGYTYALINLVAQRIAGQPIRLARILQPGQKQKRPEVYKDFLPTFAKDYSERLEILEDHKLLRIIREPNTFLVCHQLMTMTVASTRITGKAYWWMIYNEDTGRDEIWPLPASWVEPYHDPSKPNELWTEWLVRPEGYVEQVKIPLNDICFFFEANPQHPLRALSPLQALARSVMADENVEETQRRSFTNALNPGLALIIGRLPGVASVAGTTSQDDRAVLNTQQKEAIIARIKQHYRGVLNWDEPLILDGLIKDVKKISPTPRELDFLQSGLSTKNRLAQGWGINPVSLGELEGANRATAAVADDHLLMNVVNPKIELLSQILTVKVAPRYAQKGERLLLYIEPGRSHDPELELATDMQLYDRAIIGKNDVRKKRGYPPLVDGDVALVGGTEYEIVVDSTSRGAPPGVAGWSKSKERAARPAPRVADWGKWWVKSQAGYERRMQKTIAGVLQEIGRELKEEAKRVGNGPVSSVFIDHVIQTERWAARMGFAVKDLVYEAALLAAYREWEAHHRKSMLPRAIIEAVSKFAAQIASPAFWRGVVQNAVDKFKRVLGKVQRAGERGQRAVERAITRTFGHNASLAAAEEPARTESSTALNAGQYEAQKELNVIGAVKKRRWCTMRDSKVRDTHKEAEGQEVGVSAPFFVGGYHAYYPGDPNLPAKERCRCRCWCQAVT